MRWRIFLVHNEFGEFNEFSYDFDVALNIFLKLIESGYFKEGHLYPDS
ncbi:hypothetical protein ES702_05217 [subsurface metagenome]